MSPFNFNGLFVLDLANNHQGDLEHATNIIRAMGEVAGENGVRAALKFQFRHLDTFIHPDHTAGSSNKHVDRFLSTRMTNQQFARLADEVRNSGMITMATPFDEESVDLASDLDIDILKVASCSATDWPLMERIAEANKPVIFSTGGLTMKQIDALVSFFDHRRVRCAIMHCVSIYPTPKEHLHLNQITALKRRYPDKVIGFSTHEEPDETSPAHIAIGLGAGMLERHVGIETDTIKLNKYSSTPAQVDRWMKAAIEARQICGSLERVPPQPEETEALRSLMRGVYLRRPIAKGQLITRDDVYFAIPLNEGQLTSGQWVEGIVSTADLDKDQALTTTEAARPKPDDTQALTSAIHGMKAMLNEAQISLPPTFETEFSHHFGVRKFQEVGATLITFVNREYCKKLILQLPGQRHPAHYHKAKEETFVVLHGKLELVVEGRHYTLYPGDMQLVQQGVWHEFWTDTGVIFEEISSKHGLCDSFYEDKSINSMDADSRKTRVNQWGRYQLLPAKTNRRMAA
ncbi:N-acetylneuraminate synthase family protein [Bremerella sp.]|uniref:N-acetylneuraminate synthase family protein n=1 Tax=Bremerella sp. TaxID=2795602 RepID=UPI00391DF1EB